VGADVLHTPEPFSNRCPFLAPSDSERLAGIAAVGDDHGPPGGCLEKRQAGDVERCEKAILRERHLGEMAFAITSQSEPIACVSARGIRLGIVEISGYDQIEVPIAVHIGRDDALDRRDLGEVRQRRRAERTAPAIVQVHAGKRIHLIVERPRQVARGEDLSDREIGR
jgi:hypothetical protein